MVTDYIQPKKKVEDSLQVFCLNVSQTLKENGSKHSSGEGLARRRKQKVCKLTSIQKLTHNSKTKTSLVQGGREPLQAVFTLSNGQIIFLDRERLP